MRPNRDDARCKGRLAWLEPRPEVKVAGMGADGLARKCG